MNPRVARVVLFLWCALTVGACGSSSARPNSSEPPRVDALLASLRASAGRLPAKGSDVWEVAVCRIPEDHDEVLYDMSGIRLAASAHEIVDQLGPVSEYFSRWSNGRYLVEFVASQRDVLPEFGSAEQCIDRALEQSSSEASGVLVVADAQHRDDVGGGWGRQGQHCVSSCSLEDSKRAVYLGAADFVLDPPIPLDLIEHELGHALGWPHSRRDLDYDSGLDVMSDSSAGRRVNPSRVHAPGVLAINRYLSGWTDNEPILVDFPSSTEFQLVDTSFAVIGSSASSVLTVEVIVNSGENDHLGSPGVAVHLVAWGPDVCSDPVSIPGASAGICAGVSRSHRLVAPDSSRDGLMHAGDRIEVAGTTVLVESITENEGTFTARIGVDRP